MYKITDPILLTAINYLKIKGREVQVDVISTICEVFAIYPLEEGVKPYPASRADLVDNYTRSTFPDLEIKQRLEMYLSLSVAEFIRLGKNPDETLKYRDDLAILIKEKFNL